MKKLDIFGSQISIRFQGRSIHKTKFGAFFTLGVVIIISVRLYFIITQIYEGVNPQVVQQERQVDHPKKFVINSQTYSFAIGLKDQKYKFYDDERIFKMEGVQATRKQVLNETTNQLDAVWNYTKFQLEKCADDYLNDEGISNYFIRSQYYSHYCLPKNLDLEIEGEFNSHTYSEIRVLFTRCKGSSCLSDPEINKILDAHYIEILFSDVYMQPKQKQNPFKKYARDLYWTNSQKLPRNAYINLRNNYVDSDVGWFYSDIQTDIYPSFSYSESQIVDLSNDYFFKVVLRFEKQKEQLYTRQYQKVINIISELGGLYQFIIFFGYLICTKYSQLHLNRQLINDIFDFKQLKEEEEKNQNSFENAVQEISNKVEEISKSKTKSLHHKGVKTQTHTINAKNKFTISLQHNKSIDIIKQDKSPQTFLKMSLQNNDLIAENKMLNSGGGLSFTTVNNSFANYVSPPKKASQFQFNEISNKQSIALTEQVIDSDQFYRLNSIKKLFSKITHQYSFSIFKYYVTYFCRFRNLKNEKKVVDYSVEKLYEHLDVQNILQKLIEIEKIKSLFLNDDQIALLEYLPKPSIQYFLSQKNKLIIQNNKNEIFYRKEHSVEEKTTRAIEAFRNILNNKKLTKIDQKIIKFIDPKFNYILSNDNFKMNPIIDGSKRQIGEDKQSVIDQDNESFQQKEQELLQLDSSDQRGKDGMNSYQNIRIVKLPYSFNKQNTTQQQND